MSFCSFQLVEVSVKWFCISCWFLCRMLVLARFVWWTTLFLVKLVRSSMKFENLLTNSLTQTWSQWGTSRLKGGLFSFLQEETLHCFIVSHQPGVCHLISFKLVLCAVNCFVTMDQTTSSSFLEEDSSQFEKTFLITKGLLGNKMKPHDPQTTQKCSCSPQKCKLLPY